MKNNKHLFIKSIKDKFSDIPLKKLIGKLTFACIFLWYTKSLYKKMQFKHRIADIQVNKSYKQK